MSKIPRTKPVAGEGAAKQAPPTTEMGQVAAAIGAFSAGAAGFTGLPTAAAIATAASVGLFAPLGLAGAAIAAGAAAAAGTKRRSERKGERLVAMVDPDVCLAARRTAFEKECSLSHVVNSVLRLALLPETIPTSSDAAGDD